MKKSFVFVLAPMLFAFFVAFQANAAGPKIVVPKTDQDFGVAREDTKVVTDFTVVNEGDEPLEIERVATS